MMLASPPVPALVAYVPDAPVTAIARFQGRTIVGGPFTRWARPTGPLVAVSTADAQRSGPTFAVDDGVVRAIVSDAAGGWYIGGTFTSIAGGAHVGIAHVRSDGSPDPAFAPALQVGAARAPGSVTTLAVAGGAVYAAGSFDSVDGVARPGVAGFQADGALTPFAPTHDGAIAALASDGPTIYVAGSFTTIVGAARASLAALDAAGTVQPFDAVLDGSVDAVLVRDNVVYACGSFLTAGGTPRTSIAAFDQADGRVTSWTPTINVPDWQFYDPHFREGTCRLAVDAGRVYVAYGRWISAWSRGAAATQVWSDALAGNDAAEIAVDGDRLYVGSYQSLTLAPDPAQRLDAATGARNRWDPHPIGSVFAFAFTGSTVVLAGSLRGVNAVDRGGLAEILADGTVGPWHPAQSGVPTALVASASHLWAVQVGRRTLIAFDRHLRPARLSAADVASAVLVVASGSRVFVLRSSNLSDVIALDERSARRVRGFRAVLPGHQYVLVASPTRLLCVTEGAGDGLDGAIVIRDVNRRTGSLRTLVKGSSLQAGLGGAILDGNTVYLERGDPDSGPDTITAYDLSRHRLTGWRVAVPMGSLGLVAAHGTVWVAVETSPPTVRAYAPGPVARAVLTWTPPGLVTALLADSLGVAVATDRSVLALGR